MFKKILGLIPRPAKAGADAIGPVFQVEATDRLEVAGIGAFDFAGALEFVNDLPVPDWKAVVAWAASTPALELQARAWGMAELAWLGRLQAALGDDHHLARHENALVLSSLEPRVATATAQFMTKTKSRIQRVLDGIARPPAWGRDILLVFGDEDTYYRYASRYYPEDGEFAFSGGIHVNAGCSHFATHAEELRTIEPVIAHEMTHGCLKHLPIPAWLNEGLAVNTEHRLCPPPGRRYTPQQLHWMHRQFWTADRIQEFWAGTSFLRPDDGNLLSYELARILTEQFAQDWPRFQAFVNQAQRADSGHEAALRILGIDLGRTVSSIFELEGDDGWAPRPEVWQGEPERGAFGRRPGIALHPCQPRPMA